MRISDILTEARRHEQVFPRVEEEQLAVDYLKALDKNELDQHYVHMGEASVKFGARPTIYHLDNGDPVGLYAYPATYWLKSTKPGILPYGENYPLIWIFRVDAALTVKPGSNKEKQAIQKLKKSHMLIAHKFPGFKTKPHQLELAQVLSNLSSGNLISTLHEAAEYILAQDPTTHDRTRKSVIVTVLLRMLGVKFIRGYGAVIESEAVLLDTSAAQNIKLFNRSPGSVAKNPNRPTRDQRLSPERDEFEPIMYPSPPSTSSLSKYIRYAISQADQGKMPAEREKAEAKMYAILKPGSSRLSHYMADTDEFLQNLVVDYRDQVVHKLGIEWTNPKYAPFFNKLDYR